MGLRLAGPAAPRRGQVRATEIPDEVFAVPRLIADALYCDYLYSDYLV
jgi:hypothetical protein